MDIHKDVLDEGTMILDWWDEVTEEIHQEYQRGSHVPPAIGAAFRHINSEIPDTTSGEVLGLIRAFMAGRKAERAGKLFTPCECDDAKHGEV